ncbi:MAG: flavodoxin [Lachnospiraceae bacterium]
MRRVQLTALLLGAILLTGCGSSGSVSESAAQTAAAQITASEADTAETAASSQTTSENTAAGGSRILVLYFDQGMNSDGAGDTEADAITSASLADGIPDGIVKNDILVMKDEIVARTGADEAPVLINETYAPRYEDMVNQAETDQEQDRQFTFRQDLPDLGGYDTIFVGMPVWWGSLPQPMVNVFEQLDFSDKTIIPFGIHLGSRFGNMVNQMEEMEPDATVSGDGLSISGHTTNAEAVSDVDDWLTGLGY